MSNPQISVVLGTFNQQSVLQKVLLGYETQTLSFSEFEVIVVDSSSTDGTADWLHTYRPAFNLRCITQENRGKAAARNRGIREARGKWIVITDADMIPHPDWVQRHLEAQRSVSIPACFEGLTYMMTSLQWPTQPSNLRPLIPSNPKSYTRLGWFYFLTGNLSFPKVLVESHHGFDETFQSYGWEDLELGYRMSRNSIPLYALREAINYHYHVVSEAEEIVRNVDKGRSAKLVLAKHPQLKWFLGLNPLSVGLFAKLPKNGKIFQWMEAAFQSQVAWKHRLGAWFLKEHAYLTGILE